MTLLTVSISMGMASDQGKVEAVMLKYLKAIKAKDRKMLKSVVTDKYYQTLDKEDGIKNLFAMQPKDSGPIKVDVKVIKQKKGYRANIKDKSDQDYDDYWYEIVVIGDQYKIDGTFHLEEPAK